jgi:hypothetical protein
MAPRFVLSCPFDSLLANDQFRISVSLADPGRLLAQADSNPHVDAKARRTHGSRYSFSQIFFMMFRPKKRSDMDDGLWADFEAVQTRNMIWSGIIVFGAFLVLMAAIYLNAVVRGA